MSFSPERSSSCLRNYTSEVVAHAELSRPELTARRCRCIPTSYASASHAATSSSTSSTDASRNAVQVVARAEGLDPAEARGLQAAGEHHVAVQPRAGGAAARRSSSAPAARSASAPAGPSTGPLRGEIARRGRRCPGPPAPHEVGLERDERAAGVGLVAARERAAAVRAGPQRPNGAPSPPTRSPAPVGRVPVLVGADGDDPARVDQGVGHVVVAADVVEAHRLGDAGRLVEVARVRPEVRVVDDPAQAALEVDVVDGVEAQQRR